MNNGPKEDQESICPQIEDGCWKRCLRAREWHPQSLLPCGSQDPPQVQYRGSKDHPGPPQVELRGSKDHPGPPQVELRCYHGDQDPTAQLSADLVPEKKKQTKKELDGDHSSLDQLGILLDQEELV
ncbi:unnamed protein product [Arctogadus glacialis]